MRLLSVVAALAALMLVALAGCGIMPVRKIEVEMTNYRLTPSLVEVKAGETIQFVLVNKSDTEHDFVSQDVYINEVTVKPGKTRLVRWTAPVRTGEYAFRCGLEGHEPMVMIVRVVN